MVEILSYPFFQRAIIAVLLVSLSCGVIGTYIVSRRIVFISGGLAHISFGGIGMGYFAGIHPLLGAGIFATISSLIMEYLARKSRMRIDTVIGILWSFGMALGIIFIALTPGYTPNLMSYLFGGILTVGDPELWAMAAIALSVTLFFLLFSPAIFTIAFDEDFAMSRRIPVRLLSSFLMILIALTVVISIRAVGLILVISILTIPQASSSLLTSDYRRMIPLSVTISAVASLAGLFLSYSLDIPSGATIITTLVLLFLLLRGITLVREVIMVRRRSF